MTRLKLKYIHEYVDRKGKLRRYFRRPGCSAVALPALPGSAEFMQAYQDALQGAQPVSMPHAPGTLAALAVAFYRSTEFANLKASLSQSTRPDRAPRRPPPGARHAIRQGAQAD
jgi:hypothetical protein